MGFFKEIFGLGKELVEIISDGKKELTEIMTDGFKEMVVKGNNGYKTSYEKRDEANNIVANAKSRYNRSFDDVQSKFIEVQSVVEKHYKYKAETYNRIKQEHSSNIEKYIRKYDMKKKEIDFSGSSTSPFNASALSIVSNISTGNLMGIVSGLDLGMQRKRVQEADDLLEEAKEIKAKLNLECERLNQVKSNLLLIEKTVEEERAIISRLLIPLEEKMIHVEKIINGVIKTKDQLKEAEIAIDVVKLLEQTLTTQFLKEKTVITKQYQDLTFHLIEMEKVINQGRE